MNQIVCVSNFRWEEEPCRLKELLRPLRQDAEVLLFEPAQPLFSKLRRPKEGTPLRRGVTAYTLPVQVDWSEDVLHRVQRLSDKNARFISQRMAEHGFQNPLLWLSCPSGVWLMDQLPYSGLVYDCDRTWNGEASRWEVQLCRDADVVFAASEPLLLRLRHLSSNVTLLENGVDYESFSALSKQTPALFDHLSGPVAGCLEDVGDFTDLEPLRYTAAAMPECSFLLMGRVSRTNPGYQALLALENVHLLGKVPRDEQPGYLCRLDAALLLHDPRALTPETPSHVIYSYLAAGCPIVAALTPERPRFYPEVIRCAETPQDFLTACRDAIHDTAPEGRALRLALAIQSGWSVRSEALRRLLLGSGLLSVRR